MFINPVEGQRSLAIFWHYGFVVNLIKLFEITQQNYTGVDLDACRSFYYQQIIKNTGSRLVYFYTLPQ